MNKYNKKLILLIVVFGILLGCYLCYKTYDFFAATIFPEKLEEREQGYLYFDPNTILTNLKKDNMISFFNNPVLMEDELSGLVFTSEDYLALYERIHQYVWNEPIHKMDGDILIFLTSCDKVDEGYKYSKITLFTIRKNPSKVRILHTISIYADEGKILWGEDIYSGHINRRESLDLYDLKISPIEVIKKAEIEGFSCQSLQLEDDAEIRISIGAGRFLEGWYIVFNQKYEIILNKDTGEILYRDLPE